MLDLLKSIYDTKLYQDISFHKNCTCITMQKEIDDEKLLKVGKFLSFHKKTPTKIYRNKVGNSIFLMVEYVD